MVLSRHLQFISLVLFSACTSQNVSGRYNLAEKFFTDQNYPAAVNEFEKVYSKDSQTELGRRALLRAAVIEYLYLKKYNDALQKFFKYLEASPSPDQRWEVNKYIGEIYFTKLEQYDQAIRHYLQQIQARPDSTDVPEMMWRVAKSRFFRWEFDEAIEVFQDIIKQFPRTDWAEKAAFEVPNTYFTRGEQRAVGNRNTIYQETIQEFNKFIKAYPKSKKVVEAEFNIAACLEELDQLESAFQIYERIKNDYPSPKVVQIKLHRITERRTQRNR